MAKAFYLHALTPVHSGTGQAVAVIDLPIAREKATGFPVIPASSIKGVLRDTMTGQDGIDQDWIDQAFGRGPSDKDQGIPGALTFTDQKILCLPVRSYFGTFAQVTCPLVLERFKRDMDVFKIKDVQIGNIPKVVDSKDEMKIALTDSTVLANQSKVYLEDLDLSHNNALSADATTIAGVIAGLLFSGNEVESFKERFAIVSDATFSFLCETATEIAARIALDENSKTVKQGQLWYEEAVPAETIFHGVVMMADHYKQNGISLDDLKIDKPIQIGGNATVGRGLCRVVLK